MNWKYEWITTFTALIRAEQKIRDKAKEIDKLKSISKIDSNTIADLCSQIETYEARYEQLVDAELTADVQAEQNRKLVEQISNAHIRANDQAGNINTLSQQLREEQTLRSAAVEAFTEKNLSLGQQLMILEAERLRMINTDCFFRGRAIFVQERFSGKTYTAERFNAWYGRIADKFLNG